MVQVIILDSAREHVPTNCPAACWCVGALDLGMEVTFLSNPILIITIMLWLERSAFFGRGR